MDKTTSCATLTIAIYSIHTKVYCFLCGQYSCTSPDVCVQRKNNSIYTGIALHTMNAYLVLWGISRDFSLLELEQAQLIRFMVLNAHQVHVCTSGYYCRESNKPQIARLLWHDTTSRYKTLQTMYTSGACVLASDFVSQSKLNCSKMPAVFQECLA